MLAARLSLLAAIILTWQMVVTFDLLDRAVTSSPSDVAAFLVEVLPTPELRENLWATVQATLIAFVLASSAGILVGSVLGLMPTLERIIDPFLNAANAMPRIALAPVFIIAFGLTIWSKVALAFTIVIFIMISNTIAGMHSVDSELLRLAKVLGATRRQLFVKLLLPSAVPSIFGGLRLGMIYSMLGVVTAELIGSTNGMGQLVQQAAGMFMIDRVWGYLIILAVIASAVNVGMSAVERYLLRWRP